MKRTLVLGGPGAGKTTRLLREMESALARGVPPDRIAFASFTRAAVREARDRACVRFGLQPADLPHFRTLHSLAFRELGIRPDEIVRGQHLVELAELTGELATDDRGDSEVAAGANADPLLTVDHYARTTEKPLRDAWEDHGGDLDWWRLLRFSEAYRGFKDDRGLLDFTDLLLRYADEPTRPLDVDLAIVDEAQDLTPLQCRVALKAFGASPHLLAAGDDDQTIHRWAGSSGDRLFSLGWDRDVLPLSHRLPREVFNLSLSILSRIEHRMEKQLAPGPTRGSVEHVADPSEVDLSTGSWLLLARTRRQLLPLIEVARDQGVAYSAKGRASVAFEHVEAIRAYETMRAGREVEADDGRRVAAAARSGKRIEGSERVGWADAMGEAPRDLLWHDALISIPIDDREHYLGIMRRGGKLTDPPRVRIETIHGAKGMEAEGVVLVTDMTGKTLRGFELDADAEHRVFYVGVTRAAKALHVVVPRTPYGYPI